MIAPRCDVFWFSVTRRMGKGANAPCLRELKVRVRFASLSPPYSLRAAWNIAGRRAGDSSQYRASFGARNNYSGFLPHFPDVAACPT